MPGGGFPHVLVWSPSCYMFVWTDHDGDVVSYRRRWLVCFGHGWCLNWCIFWVTHSWYTDTVACLMQTWGGAFGWEQEVAIRKPKEFHHHHIMIIITLKVATPSEQYVDWDNTINFIFMRGQNLPPLLNDISIGVITLTISPWGSKFATTYLHEGSAFTTPYEQYVGWGNNINFIFTRDQNSPPPMNNMLIGVITSTLFYIFIRDQNSPPPMNNMSQYVDWGNNMNFIFISTWSQTRRNDRVAANMLKPPRT